MNAKSLVEERFRIPAADVNDHDEFAAAVARHIEQYVGDVVDETMPEDEAREEVWTLAIDAANDMAGMTAAKGARRIDQAKVIAAAKHAAFMMGYGPKGYRPPKPRPSKPASPEPKSEEPRVVKPTGIAHGVYMPPGIKPKVQEDEDDGEFPIGTLIDGLNDLLKAKGYANVYSEWMAPENVGFVEGHPPGTDVDEDPILFNAIGLSGDVTTGDIRQNKGFEVTKCKLNFEPLAEPVTVHDVSELDAYVS